MAIIPNHRKDWESVFSRWSQAPGKTEQAKCNRAVQMIKAAVMSDPILSIKQVDAFPQGSYHNRTNVRQDSDVDVCVICRDSFFYDLPPRVPANQIRFEPATYRFKNYKNDVERALVNKFGQTNVRRGNKAFDINENTSRVDADAAPCFVYRQYFINPNGSLDYHEGTALIADGTGHHITNFPIQQYDNGVKKNNNTGRRFKKAVRIVKKLRNVMDDSGVPSARDIASFLIESLIWNAPDKYFGSQNDLSNPMPLYSMTQNILAYLWHETKNDDTCIGWKEENGFKQLFNYSQSWNRAHVNQFLYDAWFYIRNG